MMTLVPVQGGRRQRSGWAAASALVLAAGAGSAWVAQGGLDPTFNGDGKVTTAFFAEAHASATVYAVAVQPDGKIVAAGSASRGSGSDFALARYYADGSLDASFSGDGKLTTDIFGGQDSAYAVAVQPDGKIVAVGAANINAASWFNRFTLVRYHANGSLDTSFGTGAIVSTDFLSDNIATSVALQADGKIVVVGAANDGFGWRVALARYNADGSLDASFGTGGKETTSFFGFDDGASAVALDANGKIVVVGWAYPGGANNQFALARYHIDGSLDASFGAGGKVTTDFFGANDIGYSVVLQSDGRIVAAGLAYPVGSGTDQFALARFNADGSLDTTFSDDGKATAEFSEAYTRHLSAAGQADGKVVAVSWGVNSATGFDVFSLARFNTDGSLDSSFGANGKVTTDFLGSQNQAFAIAVQADGQIVAAGSAFDTSVLYSQFALARYDAGSGTAPAVTLSALAVNPSSVVGGTSSAGTVTLSAAAPSGGAVVSLSENSTATSVPASLTVPSGATSATFTITTTSVTSATTSTISAAFGGVTRTASLTVNPPAPAPAPSAPTLSSPASQAINVPQPVLLDWNNVTNATSYEVQVDNSSTIAAPFVTNPTVTASQATLAAGLPAQNLWWRVRARNAAGVFGPFSSSRRFTPQAAAGPAAVTSISVTPSSVTGGTGSTGTVTLTSGAPAGGAVVSLTSSNTAIAGVPVSVTVAAGATTATFAATSSSVTASSGVTLSASYAGVTRTATLTVNPPGQSATLTVTASGRSGERVTSTPAGISVNVGSSGSAAFNTGTSITLRVTNDRDAIWSGGCSSGGNKTKTCTFTLNGSASVNANVQ